MKCGVAENQNKNEVVVAVVVVFFYLLFSVFVCVFSPHWEIKRTPPPPPPPLSAPICLARILTPWLLEVTVSRPLYRTCAACADRILFCLAAASWQGVRFKLLIAKPSFPKPGVSGGNGPPLLVCSLSYR